MRYLGITSKGHDASVCVVHGDNIVFAAHQERYSGIKNDGMLGLELVSKCREIGFDRVVWYEHPVLKASRQLFAGQFKAAWDTLKVRSHLASLGITQPIDFVGHHESHAAGGYFTSPFSDAVVLVCDAIGEWDTISVWHCVGDDMVKIHSQSYPHSLGLFYSAMTQRVGKKPNEEEYIMMGMAALGDPRRLKGRILDEFVLDTDSEIPEFKTTYSLHRGCRDWAPDLTTDQDMYDIAAAVQEITEDFLISLTSTFSHFSNNLVISGGVALNCRANARIAKVGDFEHIWIMPNPGDAGSSLGAVAARTRRKLKWDSVYLGCDVGHETNYPAVLDALVRGDVVGLATGKAEWGPRALGHRSILVDPRGPDTKDKVNKFKRREPFRPFAPIILREFADQYFDMPVGDTPYMQFTAKCRFPEQFPAVCHYDGTSRVQTLTIEQEPQLYQLLVDFHKATGCPMLLNTSMNIKGNPLVNTWEQALEFQAETGITVY